MHKLSFKLASVFFLCLVCVMLDIPCNLWHEIGWRFSCQILYYFSQPI